MTQIVQTPRFKTERDIVLVNLLSAMLILVIVFFPNAQVRTILGLPFVWFFTGYVSISALFPRKEELDIIERVAFSIALSVAITSLTGLILNYTPFGIRVHSVLFSLFSFILLVSIVVLYRRRAISPSDVFAPLAPDRDNRRFDATSEKDVGHEIKRETRVFSKIKLEYILLPLFIALALFFYHQRYFSYIYIVIAAVIGVLLFIILNKYTTKEELVVPSTGLREDKSCTLQLITSTLFVIFYGLSFLTLLHGFYTKTVWYYIFISLCAGVIATEILFVKTKAQGMLNLTKSFLLVLNITLSNQILFPYGISLSDLGIHLNILFPIVNNGYVPHVSGYEFFPCHHILVAASSLIAGSDPREMYLYLGGFVICLGMLFVFLIGRKLMNLQFGLFAALIYTCLDCLIMYGSHPVHQSYSYFLSIALFAVILYAYEKRDPRFTVFFVILITSMVFTHHYSAMIISIVLSSLVMVEIFYRITENDYKFRLSGLFQMFLVILFAQWIYYANFMGSFVIVFSAYKSAFEKGAESLIVATAYDKLPIGTLFMNTLGSSILIVLSVIGFLFFLKKRSFFNDAIRMTAVVISFLLAIGVVLSVQWLLADRMYPFLQLFGLVFLGTMGIMWILDISKIKKKRLNLIPVIIVIMCLAFFSTSSTIAGFETSLFVSKETAYYRSYTTPHESYFNQWQASNSVNEYLFSMDIGLEEDLNKRRVIITEKLKKEFDSRGFALPEQPMTTKEGDEQWAITSYSNRNKKPYVIRKEEGRLNTYDTLVILNNPPLTRDGSIDVQNITKNSFICFNELCLKTGFPEMIGRGHLGQLRFTIIKEDTLFVLERYEKYYDNGIVNLYYSKG